MKRGIDAEIIEECINKNLNYEEKNNHNVVFVGYDKEQKAQYRAGGGPAGAAPRPAPPSHRLH